MIRPLIAAALLVLGLGAQAQGSPAAIVAAACPDRPGADLNDAFIRLMARGKAPAGRTANLTATPASPDIETPSPFQPGDPGGIDA